MFGPKRNYKREKFIDFGFLSLPLIAVFPAFPHSLEGKVFYLHKTETNKNSSGRIREYRIRF